ncbi:RHS repeat domain-containing protein [Desulfonema ishimotonii]|uniref:RHS repeat domain-containing protein n=1 Tax=Desulfonema ishimotonii TaxID=45657 RepID=UPI000F5793C6|nr:RHS repeat domain-containing protein [Desulfonema ishimotonii]
MTDNSGTTLFTYDAVNRLTSRTDANGFTVSYAYDEAGNLASLTYPGNKIVTYTHDALNRLETVTDWQGRTAAYSYDDAGRLTRLTQFNGTIVNYTYDNANRLTGLANLTGPSGTTIASYAFTLDQRQQDRHRPDTPLACSPPHYQLHHRPGNRLESDGTNTFTTMTQDSSYPPTAKS